MNKTPPKATRKIPLADIRIKMSLADMNPAVITQLVNPDDAKIIAEGMDWQDAVVTMKQSIEKYARLVWDQRQVIDQLNAKVTEMGGAPIDAPILPGAPTCGKHTT